MSVRWGDAAEGFSEQRRAGGRIGGAGGALIAFEGGEGTGKSTQARLLADRRARGPATKKKAAKKTTAKKTAAKKTPAKKAAAKKAESPVTAGCRR